MSFKKKLKNAIRFILGCIPARKYDLHVVNLSPNELLKGRVALITGGTSGIGFHMAKAFLRSGAAVVITGRSEDRLQKACSELNVEGSYGERLFSVVMDNAKVELFDAIFQQILHEIETKGFKRVDILVNNAGVLGDGMPHATTTEFDKVINTNLKGVFFLSQLMGKYMKENQIAGNILNVGSSSSLRPAISAYTMSKWGIRSLTMGLAKALAPYGITVNGIAPGPTATPMLLGDDLGDIALKGSPIGRYALPEEIANMAVILVSPMGQSIVGDMVFMTGGAGVVTYDDGGEYIF